MEEGCAASGRGFWGWTARLDFAAALGSLFGLSFSQLLSVLLPSTQCLWDNELLLEAGANYCFCRTGGCLDERDWSQAPGSVPQLWGPRPCQGALRALGVGFL